MDEDDDLLRETEITENFLKRIQHSFIKLNKILENKKLTLYQTFVAYDADKNGELAVDEFAKIMKRLDSSFTGDEVQAIFDFIDTDKSKTMEFDE